MLLHESMPCRRDRATHALGRPHSDACNPRGVDTASSRRDTVVAGAVERARVEVLVEVSRAGSRCRGITVEVCSTVVVGGTGRRCANRFTDRAVAAGRHAPALPVVVRNAEPVCRARRFVCQQCAAAAVVPLVPHAVIVSGAGGSPDAVLDTEVCRIMAWRPAAAVARLGRGNQLDRHQLG